MTQNPNNPVVTLLTDFGYRDGFVGVMKGVMLDIRPKLRIVDLSHEIEQHNIQSAAFVLGQSYAYFPENSLHVVVVDPSVGSDRNILYVESLKNYVKVVTMEKTVVSYMSITQMEEKLPELKFIRIHRSFIVGVDHIEEYSASEIKIGTQHFNRPI